jgi:hypothetical protein
MLAKAILLWVVGLATFVPYGTYYLFFEASRDHYALLVTSILFWIFGYWGVVGPLIMLIKVRSVFRSMERVGSHEQLAQALESPDAKHVAIDLIATENHIPRLVAAWIYQRLIRRAFQRVS